MSAWRHCLAPSNRLASPRLASPRLASPRHAMHGAQMMHFGRDAWSNPDKVITSANYVLSEVRRPLQQQAAGGRL